MSCIHCNDTGECKQPKDKEKFDQLIDSELNKGYMVNYTMAEKKAFEEVGYDIIVCPYCKKNAT